MCSFSSQGENLHDVVELIRIGRCCLSTCLDFVCFIVWRTLCWCCSRYIVDYTIIQLVDQLLPGPFYRYTSSPAAIVKLVQIAFEFSFYCVFVLRKPKQKLDILPPKGSYLQWGRIATLILLTIVNILFYLFMLLMVRGTDNFIRPRSEQWVVNYSEHENTAKEMKNINIS